MTLRDHFAAKALDALQAEVTRRGTVLMLAGLCPACTKDEAKQHFADVAALQDEIERLTNDDTLEELSEDDEACVDEEESDDGICPNCDGSGEGMYEGTRCSACRGKGVRTCPH
jgi:hypothetical protein